MNPSNAPRAATPTPREDRPSGNDDDRDLSPEDRLLDRRIVLLVGHLDDTAAAAATARLMLLDTDHTQAIELRLSCPDADLEPSLVLAQTVEMLGAPVTAVLVGTVGGPAVAVFAAAGRRLAHQHARVWLREPRGTGSSPPLDIVSAAGQHAELLEELHTRVAAATGRAADDVAADLRAGRVLTAEEARDYGLVHDVLSPNG